MKLILVLTMLFNCTIIQAMPTDKQLNGIKNKALKMLDIKAPKLKVKLLSMPKNPESDYSLLGFACNRNLVLIEKDVHWTATDLLLVMLHEIAHTKGVAHTSRMRKVKYKNHSIVISGSLMNTVTSPLEFLVYKKYYIKELKNRIANNKSPIIESGMDKQLTLSQCLNIIKVFSRGNR